MPVGGVGRQSRYGGTTPSPLTRGRRSLFSLVFYCANRNTQYKPESFPQSCCQLPTVNSQLFFLVPPQRSFWLATELSRGLPREGSAGPARNKVNAENVRLGRRTGTTLEVPDGVDFPRFHFALFNFAHQLQSSLPSHLDSLKSSTPSRPSSAPSLTHYPKYHPSP